MIFYVIYFQDSVNHQVTVISSIFIKNGFLFEQIYQSIILFLNLTCKVKLILDVKSNIIFQAVQTEGVKQTSSRGQVRSLMEKKRRTSPRDRSKFKGQEKDRVMT